MATLTRLTADEAHLLQGCLEAEDIPASIQEDHSAGLPVAGGSLAGVRLEVPDEHARRAGEILRESREAAQGEPEVPRPDAVRVGWIRFGLILELVLWILSAASALYVVFTS